MANYLRTSLISRLAYNCQGLRFTSSGIQPTPPANKNDAQTIQSASQSLKSNHKVNDLERKFLVWTKKYKTTEEVPDFVNQDVMERTRNKIRIKVANWMMALTAVGCLIAIMSGKNAAERGETVQKSNIAWHEEYNKKAQEEYEQKKAAAK